MAEYSILWAITPTHFIPLATMNGHIPESRSRAKETPASERSGDRYAPGPEARPITGSPALEISNLHAWYGQSHILHGISLDVAQGEVVTLVGRNGSGRTTALRAMLGLTDSRKGSIRIRGTESIDLPAYKIMHLGVGYCPEKRGIFAGLTCEENLLLPPTVGDTLGGGMSLAEIYEMFPHLEERRHSPGTRLSGGEQQMLAVARILRTGANLLLLDEISEGMAPVIVQALTRMIGILKQKGYTLILAEQNFHFTAALADRFYLVEHGQILQRLDAGDLPARQHEFKTLLGA